MFNNHKRGSVCLCLMDTLIRPGKAAQRPSAVCVHVFYLVLVLLQCVCCVVGSEMSVLMKQIKPSLGTGIMWDVCVALFTLLFRLNLLVCAVILQVIASDNLFVQGCCMGCYCCYIMNASARMLQGFLSTAESAKPLLDVVSLSFLNIGFHVVCAGYKKN